jgi:hypothetical protein
MALAANNPAKAEFIVPTLAEASPSYAELVTRKTSLLDAKQIAHAQLVRDEAAYGAVQSVGSASSGKKYFEFVVTAQPAPSFNFVGIGNGSFTAPLGGDSNGAGLDVSGSLTIGGSVVGSVIAAGWNVGDAVGIAVDLDAKKLWVRYPDMSNTWNNDASANPATGANGFDMSTLAVGPYYIVYSTVGDDVITANFGGSAFAYTAPSGFGNW